MRPSIRVVIHSALFLPTQGGAELYIDNISKNLGSRYDVTILTRPSRAHWKVNTRHRIVRLRSWLLPFYFIWLMVKRRPDLLHVGLIGYESLMLFAIARIARIPRILTFHGTYSLANMRSARGVPLPVLALEDVALRSPWNKVVCVDYHSERFLLQRFRMPKERLCVIPSGVNADEFHAESVESSTDSVGRYTILCPRRVDPKNGIEYVIRASISCKAKIPGLHLLIAGRTNQGQQDYERLLREIVRSGDAESHIRFLGDVEHDKMHRLYNSADLVVIPSLAEARSLSALEAMACERPIIATRVGGLPEIIKDGMNGILVNPADVNDLAGAICRLYDAPELSRKLGQNARRVALDNDWNARTHEYEDLYQQCIRKA